MNKPIKPNKPKKSDPVPTEIITKYKLLVFDSQNNEFLLIDEKSHPDVFTDPETGEINNELFPYWSQMESLGFNWDLKRLKYSHFQKIARKIQSFDDDFEAEPTYNSDGWYDYTIVSYKEIDIDYRQKLDVYNNRFVIYEKSLAEYESDLKKYEEYKKSEKKRKLEEQLKKL